MTHEQFEKRKKEINEAQKQKPLFAKPLYPTETDMLVNYITSEVRKCKQNGKQDNWTLGNCKNTF